MFRGIILAAAGIIVRVIGMFYRIPLADILGDEGNGYYSSAFSIYSILLIVSSYSLPTAVSKMVAVRMARREYINSMKVLKSIVVLWNGSWWSWGRSAVVWGGCICKSVFKDALYQLRLKDSGTHSLDHRLSGGLSRLLPGTWDHASNGGLPDFRTDHQCGNQHLCSCNAVSGRAAFQCALTEQPSTPMRLVQPEVP